MCFFRQGTNEATWPISDFHMLCFACLKCQSALLVLSYILIHGHWPTLRLGNRSCGGDGRNETERRQESCELAPSDMYFLMRLLVLYSAYGKSKVLRASTKIVSAYHKHTIFLVGIEAKFALRPVAASMSRRSRQCRVTEKVRRSLGTRSDGYFHWIRRLLYRSRCSLVHRSHVLFGGTPKRLFNERRKSRSLLLVSSAAIYTWDNI